MWETEVALHVQKGFTHFVNPVVFSNNAPMFERVAALIRQEKACAEERREQLQLLVAAQLDVTRTVSAAQIDHLGAQLVEARELRQSAGDDASKVTTRFFKEELAAVRTQLDDSEAQRAAADKGREMLRLQHAHALQTLRAGLERSYNWIPEQAGRGAMQHAEGDATRRSGCSVMAAAAVAAAAERAVAAEGVAAPLEAKLRSELRAAVVRCDGLENEAAALRLEAARLQQVAGPHAMVVTLDGGFGSAEWAVSEHRRLAAEARLLVPELHTAEALAATLLRFEPPPLRPPLRHPRPLSHVQSYL